jgi:hypothetical protein
VRIRDDGRYECAFCGAILDVPVTVNPRVTIRAATDAPKMRVILIDGEEVHRCEVPAKMLDPDIANGVLDDSIRWDD